MMLRALTALASPAGARAKLSVLIFHRVMAAPDPLQPDVPDAERFDQILGWLGGQFRVLDPVEACERLVARSLPARAAMITFDDGYRDNAEVALPILQRHGMRAAFFIATGFLGGGVMFNDRVIEAVRSARRESLTLPALGAQALSLQGEEARRMAIDAILRAVKHLPFERRAQAVAAVEGALGGAASFRPMMSEAQLRELHDAGMTLGGHTRNHPILRVLDDAAARHEIEGGRDDLRAITGVAPRLFAYPNGREGGDFDGQHVRMVRGAGFEFAFTTHAGSASADTDRYRIPRFTPWDRGSVRFRLRMLNNLQVRERLLSTRTEAAAVVRLGG